MREAQPLTPEPRALRFLQVVEHSPTPVLIVDRAGLIEHANAAFVSETGWTADAMRSREWRTLLAGAGGAPAGDAVLEALRANRAWRGPVVLAQADGRERAALASLVPLGPDAGAALYFAEVPATSGGQDGAPVTAVSLAPAPAGPRTTGEFLQRMSPALQTPMNSILGMADVLLQSPLSLAQRADLLALKRSANQLLTAISQLFDLAHHESGQPAPRAVPFRLRACLREVHDPLAAEAEVRGLGWEIEIDSSVPDPLLGDAEGLRQALSHLVDNALKFTDHGRVVLRVVEQSHDDHQAMLRFEIADTGVGIAAERQADLFEAFERADVSGERPQHVLGLGLTLASRIVRRMGGRLEVESAPGTGSTFRFALAFGRAARAEPAPGEGKTLEDSRLLLVDAGSASRTGATAMLKRVGGGDVVVAPGPDAAESVLEHELEAGGRIDAVILDQRSGALDAFAITARLRRSFAGRLPPVLLLTTVGERGDAERCEDLGIGAYLTHPVSDGDVRDALRHLLAAPHPQGRRVLVTRHLLRETRTCHRVLLVEDNAINRRVATRLLERSGYEVGVAGNGREAVEMFPGGGWDIVLMDVQMPEMDGLQATRAIRAWESEHGVPRTPIVAVTAHAREDNRSAVTKAGMDDFVAKPIEAAVLFEVMGRHLAEGAGAPVSTAMRPDLREVLDWDEVLDRMDGDEVVLREILALFGQDAPNMMQKLEEARASGDLHRVERAAHGLKGASATISARAVAPLAQRVEQLAREDRLPEALDLMDELRREMQRLVRALEGLPEPRKEAA